MNKVRRARQRQNKQQQQQQEHQDTRQGAAPELAVCAGLASGQGSVEPDEKRTEL